MEIFTWRAPEYPHREKTKDWYWTVGIITVALAVTAIIFKNILFAIVLLIGAFTLTIFSARKPKIVTVAVDGKGIRVEKTLYPYNALESFGIDTEHLEGPRLHLKSKKAMMPLITIPAGTDDLDGLRVLLSKHLKEEAFEQSIWQTLFERLGF